MCLLHVKNEDSGYMWIRVFFLYKPLRTEGMKFFALMYESLKLSVNVYEDVPSTV